MERISVLMSVYDKEKPEFLDASIKSILRQNVLPSEIVIVKDGPLNMELENVLSKYQSLQPSLFEFVPLEKNMGLGKALNIGLKHCSNNLVARMDSDDICKHNRFERQLQIVDNNPSVDVVGSNIDEFIDSIENIVSSRKLPEWHCDIVKYAKKRSPINHPSVMFKKSSVIESGGYVHMHLLEDYYLWIRMIKKGYKFYNIQESLLYFRTNKNMIKRRGGLKYAKSEVKFYISIYKLGAISFFDLLINLCVRSFVRLSPNVIRQFIYRTLLR